MARDTVILSSFENADDAIQGLWGLYNFGHAAVVSGNHAAILALLPQGSFQMTHRWLRYYNPQDLLSVLGNLYEPVYSRSFLLSLTSLFESVVCEFMERLSRLGHAAKVSNYKQQLEWVFRTVSAVQSPPEDGVIVGRLSKTCGDVDNARRLRNRIAHSRGQYTSRYVDPKEVINNGWVAVQTETDYGPGKPIVLSKDKFDYFVRSHLELLHVLHNEIQRSFFGHQEGYKYADEGKRIDWHKVFG